MKKGLLAASVVAVAFILSPAASAENTVTWTLAGMTAVGVPCGDTPSNACGTLQEALNNTLYGGEVRFTGPSGSTGSVFITKSVTIDGGTTSPVIVPNGAPGALVSIGTQAIDVTLRNLTLDARPAIVYAGGGWHGVRVTHARAVTIEDCNIINYDGHGVFEMRRAGSLTVRRSSIGPRYPREENEPWRSSISIEPWWESPQGGVAPPVRVLVEDSDLFGNSFAGLYVVGSARVTMARTSSRDNPRGVVATTGSDLSMSSCVIHGNRAGLRHVSSIVRLHANTFTSNAEHVWSDGGDVGTIYTAGANMFDATPGATLTPMTPE